MGAVVSEAALKIEALMAKTESYWAAKRAADIVKLAQTARALSKEVAAAGAANRIVLAQGAFVKLNANCNACHDCILKSGSPTVVERACPQTAFRLPGTFWSPSD